MAAVRIDTGPIEATASIANVPAERWRELLSKRRSFLALNLPSDCRYLLQFVTEAEKARMWEQTGHVGLADLVKRGLELDPRDVTWALEGLRSFKPSEAIRYEDAIKLGRRGRPKRGEEKGCARNLNRGTAEHWRARMKRNDPADAISMGLRAAVLRGDVKPGTAAKQMGWRKPPDAYRQLCKWWKAATEEQRAAFVAHIAEWLT